MPSPHSRAPKSVVYNIMSCIADADAINRVPTYLSVILRILQHRYYRLELWMFRVVGFLFKRHEQSGSGMCSMIKILKKNEK